ncbi:MAG: type IV pilin protein [Steroidobacteraceae bacterium]
MSQATVHGACRQRGVTLIELLIVIVVLSMLSTLAVSSYRRYALRANRTEATTTLLRIQVAQEKFFLQNNRYADGSTELTAAPPAGLGIGLGSGDVTQGGGFYAITLDAADATHYTATATARAGQTHDVSECQAFTIDQQGTRTPAESTGCWK